MEQILKSIRNEALNHQIQKAVDTLYDEYASDKEFTAMSYLVSEKSLAKDWLSEEDDRWDKILK